MHGRCNRGTVICSPCVTLEELPRRKAKENVNGMGVRGILGYSASQFQVKESSFYWVGMILI